MRTLSEVTDWMYDTHRVVLVHSKCAICLKPIVFAPTKCDIFFIDTGCDHVPLPEDLKVNDSEVLNLANKLRYGGT